MYHFNKITLVDIMFDRVINSSFLGLLLVLFALQQPEALVAAALLMALFATFRTFSATIDLNTLIITFLVALMLLATVALGANFGASPVFYLFSTLSAFYAAKRFSSFPLKMVRKTLEIVFWIAVVAIVCELYLHWGAQEPLGDIIPGSSTNGIPSYLIALQVALAIAVVMEVEFLPVAPAIATFVIAMFGLGRGSIVVAALILTSTVTFNFFFGRGPWRSKLFRNLMSVWLSGSLVIFGYLWQAGAIEWHVVETKLAVMGLSDPARSGMLSDYMNKLDGWSVLFGADYSGTSIESLYEGNPHNSYIRLHSYFGIIGLILVAFSPFALLAWSKCTRIKYAVFVLILLVLIRAATEPILFPTALDFLYFLYFFMFWKHGPAKEMIRRGDRC